MEDRVTRFDLYVTAASWSFTTMTTVGYGDIYPCTPNEKIFGTFCMILACGIFAFLVGSINSIIDSHTLIEDFKQKIIHINGFMVHS